MESGQAEANQVLSLFTGFHSLNSLNWGICSDEAAVDFFFGWFVCFCLGAVNKESFLFNCLSCERGVFRRGSHVFRCCTVYSTLELNK